MGDEVGGRVGGRALLGLEVGVDDGDLVGDFEGFSVRDGGANVGCLDGSIVGMFVGESVGVIGPKLSLTYWLMFEQKYLAIFPSSSLINLQVLTCPEVHIGIDIAHREVQYT